jgi:hypothetical protein
MARSEFKIDREKYLRIAQSEGVSAALTRLHKDVEVWEHEAFEGKQGWQPAMWQELENVRAFSRELWDLTLNNPNQRP